MTLADLKSTAPLDIWYRIVTETVANNPKAVSDRMNASMGLQALTEEGMTRTLYIFVDQEKIEQVINILTVPYDPAGPSKDESLQAMFLKHGNEGDSLARAYELSLESEKPKTGQREISTLGAKTAFSPTASYAVVVVLLVVIIFHLSRT